MLRLLGFLFMFSLTAGGFMFVDYKMSARWSGREESDALTFSEYLGGLSGRLSSLGGASAAGGMPTKLADMLPKPPEGWTARPVAAADLEGFLPKSERKADPDALRAVRQMAQADGGSGTETVVLTYEKGDRKLIIKAVRYPNVIFTSDASLPQRIELRTQTAAIRGTEFATVRGLDLTEDLLPEGFRGRLFLAAVGGQIHLRILAPKRTSDQDLLPFLETLHVKAMNAGVIEKVDGLGDVPVIVLASALDDTARDAYLSDRATRQSDAAARAEAERVSFEKATTAAAEAPADTAEGSGGGFFGKLFGGGESPEPEPETAAKEEPATISCSTGKDGVKRCKVGADD